MSTSTRLTIYNRRVPAIIPHPRGTRTCLAMFGFSCFLWVLFSRPLYPRGTYANKPLKLSLFLSVLCSHPSYIPAARQHASQCLSFHVFTSLSILCYHASSLIPSARQHASHCLVFHVCLSFSRCHPSSPQDANTPRNAWFSIVPLVCVIIPHPRGSPTCLAMFNFPCFPLFFSCFCCCRAGALGATTGLEMSRAPPMVLGGACWCWATGIGIQPGALVEASRRPCP